MRINASVMKHARYVALTVVSVLGVLSIVGTGGGGPGAPYKPSPEGACYLTDRDGNVTCKDRVSQLWCAQQTSVYTYTDWSWEAGAMC